jgi:RNA polymerase sigma factor (sigma-70 family)
MKNLNRCICEAIKAGDEAVIQEAYESCKMKVVSFLKKKGIGKTGAHLAEDFYNDAWTEFLIKVATGKNGFVSENLKLTNFLIGIAYNMGRNASRKNCKMTYFGDFEGAEPAYEAPILEIFGQLDRETQLKQAIAKLQPDYREVVEWTYFEEVSDAEISQRSGIKEPAVRKRRERAKKMLLEYLQEQQPQATLFNNREIPKALENDENTEIKSRDQPRVPVAAEEGIPARAAPGREGKPGRKYRGPVRTCLARRRATPEIPQNHQGPGDETQGEKIPAPPNPLVKQSYRFVRIIRKLWTVLLGMAAAFLLMVMVGATRMQPQLDIGNTSLIEADHAGRPERNHSPPRADCRFLLTIFHT